jgi:hypothetical protein
MQMKTEKTERHTDGGIRFQVIGSILAGSFLVASIVAKRLSWEAVAVFVATAVTLTLLWTIFVKRNARSAAARTSELARRDSELGKISIEEAKSRAEKLLADTKRFRCVKASEPYRDTLDVMPPGLSEFFSRYARVSLEFGDAVLDRELIARSTVSDRFVRVGTDVECELAILPKQEAIYEIDDGPASEFRAYPSVYHLIVSLDEELREPNKN